MSHTPKTRRGRDTSQPKNAASSTTTTTTSQTVYERQELETRTRRTPNSAVSSPELNTSTGNGLLGTPLTREQEQLEFRNLNTRLAYYIDTIRAQEDEIVTLRRRVETINTSEAQEAQRLQETYGAEIDQLRKALDSISKDLAQATAERDELRTERKDLGSKNAALENEKKSLQKKLKESEAVLKDLRAQLSNLKDEMRDHENQINAAQAQIRDLQAQIEQLKKELQAETVRRVDAENRLLSAQEDLRFHKLKHDEQVNILRTQRTVEVTQVENRLRDDYNATLSDQLDELRVEMEAIAAQTREELEQNYQAQIEDLQNLAARNADDARNVLDELRQTQRRLTEIQSKGDKQNEEYRRMISRLENDLRSKDDDVQRLQNLLAERQVELQRLNGDLAALMEQYQDLLGEKIQLDAELAVYHKLLSAEESRLHIQQHPFPSTPTPTKGRGIKRRLGQVSHTFKKEHKATGGVNITEIDGDGQFVKLENQTDQDIVVGGWTLHMVSDEGSDNETRYKIHQHTVLKAKASMTVWSANTNVVHDPPADIAMEGRWLIGNDTMVTLSNQDGVEVATCRMIRSTSSVDSSLSASALRKRHRAGETAAEGDQKNCAIM